MNTQPRSDDSYNKDDRDDESIEAVSEEKGLESAQSLFQGENSNTEDSSSDEDKEFLKYLRFRQKAKELGLDNPPSTTINQYGGIHIENSNVESHGNIVGNDQTIENTGGFSGKTNSQSSDINEKVESIEAVFDRCQDIRQRSFMIALAAFNGCNYRIVVETSQKLQSILQPPLDVETET